MSNKHPRYKPPMDNKTWGEIVQNVDAYYAVHHKHRKDEDRQDERRNVNL